MLLSDTKMLIAKIACAGLTIVALAGCTSETRVLEGADLSRGSWAVVYHDARGNTAILDRPQLLERYRDSIRVRYNPLSMIADIIPAHATLLVLDGDRRFYDTPSGVPEIFLGDARSSFVPARDCWTSISQAGRARIAAARARGAFVSDEIPTPAYANVFTLALPVQVFTYGLSRGDETAREARIAKVTDAAEQRIRSRIAAQTPGERLAITFSPATTFVSGSAVDLRGAPVHDSSGSIASDSADFTIEMGADIQTSSRRAYERIRAIPLETLLLPSRLRSRRAFLAARQFYEPTGSSGRVGRLHLLTIPFEYYVKGTGRCPYS
jgi:hypothetical protein